MNSNKVQQQLIGEELDGLRTLLPKGFVSINRVRSMERAAAELDGSYGAYRADIARSSEAIGESQMQIVGIDKQMLEEAETQKQAGQVRLDELQHTQIGRASGWDRVCQAVSISVVAVALKTTKNRTKRTDAPTHIT